MIALLLASIGLLASYRAAREYFSPASAGLATIAIGAGSFVAWQIQARATGPAAIVAAASFAVLLWQWRVRGRVRSAWTFVLVILCLAAALPALSAPTDWLHPRLRDVLFASQGGLFATSPVVYCAVIGLVWLRRSSPALAAAGLGLIAALTLLVGASGDWWTGARPTHAAFSVLVPFLVCGAAAFVDRAGQLAARRPGAAVAAALAVLVLWNATLVSVAHRGGLRLGEPTPFGEVGADQARTLHDWIGHPPSYPANLIYAATNGVAPGRYDLFEPRRFLARGGSEGVVDIGGDDALFIGQGWHAPERGDERTFRWATGTAEILLPLDRAADLVVAIDLQPFAIPDAPPQTVTLRVNDTTLSPATLAPGWQVLEVRVGRAAWRAGVNRVRLQFGLEGRPSDRGSPDTRVLAAAIDRMTLGESSK